MSVQSSMLHPTTTSLNLTWEGDITRAVLRFAVAGTEGEHSIHLNGQPIAKTPIHAVDYDCEEYMRWDKRIFTEQVELPASLIRQGQNTLTLIGDGNASDDWTLLNAYIKIDGMIAPPPPDEVTRLTEPTVMTVQPRVAGAMVYSSGDITVTSSYGDGGTNWIRWHAPTGGTPVPLVIAVHGMGGDPTVIENGNWALKSAVETKGWALAAPNMHGRNTPNDGADSVAYIGAQYDVIDTIEYMQDNFAIDSTRIYIVGESMGGLTTNVMLAKYPDIFAGALQWMGISDVTNWHAELKFHEDEGHGVPFNGMPDVGFWNLRQRTEDEIGGPPTNPSLKFDYERRSALQMYPNMQRVPLRIYHDVKDLAVPVTHTYNLSNAVNSLTPGIIEVIAVDDNCYKSNGDLISPVDENHSPYWHCYKPRPQAGLHITPTAIMDYLEPFSRDTTPPMPLTIWTDESKSYFWLNLEQSGGDHWTHIDVSYDNDSQSIMALISDTNALTVGMNVGSLAITGTVELTQAGIGLPSVPYLMKEQGQPGIIYDYVSGYLTATLSSTGLYSMTIAPIEVTVTGTPYPRIVGSSTTTSTVTAIVQDTLGNAVPEGTSVTLTTTVGTFPNTQQTMTGVTSNGQVSLILTLNPDDAPPQVEAEALDLQDSATLQEMSVAISIAPDSSVVFKGQSFAYTYLVTNTGDVTVTNISIVDDNGTPGDTNDDFTLNACIASLEPGASNTCSRNTAIDFDTNSTVQASANYAPSLLTTSAQDTETVTVYEIDISASPESVSTTNANTTVTIEVSDSQDTSPPNGTSVQVETSSGTYMGDTSLTNGVASGVLSGLSTSGTVQISATVETDTQSSNIAVFTPAIEVGIAVSDMYVQTGELVTYTYTVSNTGEITLTNISVSDKDGTISGCTALQIAPAQFQVCGTKTATINATTIQTASVQGTDAETLLATVSDNDMVTVTPVQVEVIAHPDFIFADSVSTATITATVKDDTDTPLPDGVLVTFQTDRGTLSPSSVVAISGGQGQAIITLIADDTGDANNVVQASLGGASGQVSLPILLPVAGIALDISPGTQLVVTNEMVTFTYVLSNVGNETLTNVNITDNFGTVCTLVNDVHPGESETCNRTVSISSDVVNTATVMGTAAIKGVVTDVDTSTITIINPAIDLSVTTNQSTVISGESVMYTYRFTNTGDVPLQSIVVFDDEGTVGNNEQVCTLANLNAGASFSCNQSLALTTSVTNTALVQGTDPRDEPISATATAQVMVLQSALSLMVSPNPVIVSPNTTQTFTYTIRNIGDTAIGNIVVSDDSGTPGNNADDQTCPTILVLNPGTKTICTLDFDIGTILTRTATAIGNDSVTQIETTALILVQTESNSQFPVYLPGVLR
ncbi:MAG: prolyl oligopeptidase family serine peptidase [Chloroflexota bacterium]